MNPMVIELFAHLGKERGLNFSDIVAPDETYSGQLGKDIDGLSELNKYAVEHTSIDPISNHRRDSAFFLKAIGDLEQDEVLSENILRTMKRCRLIVTYDAIKIGQSWQQISEGLKSWILTEGLLSNDGTYHIAATNHVPIEYDFEIRSGLNPGLYTSRWSPKEEDLPSRIKNQLVPKINKLGCYVGYHRILLIEHTDFILKSEHDIISGVKKAFDGIRPADIDEVWFVQNDRTMSPTFYKVF